MKTVSLVQVGFQTGPKELNAYYLPYSVGCIWTYANTSEYVKQHYKLEHIVWRRDPIDQLAPQLAETDIVLFSCYVWNKNYSYTLAEAVKKLNSNAIIIFGGPEPPIAQSYIFKKYPYIDIVVKLEGEKILKSLLENLDNVESVPGLLINKNETAHDTGTAPRITDLEELPSPYLEGFFDEMITNNPDITWNTVLETNRGCPFQCTFCDWGSLTYQKVKKFGLERVFAEIDWMVRNCEYIAIADANFGLFVERDDMITDHFIACQKKYDKPVMWSVNWAKNVKNDVIGIVKKLTSNPKTRFWGLTLSVQSLDSNVLGIIKRRNMHAENISEIYTLAEQQGIPVYSEFIFGLPGETVESWRENFYKLMRLGIHSFVDVNLNQLLENSEMTLIQKDEYHIKTTTVYDFMAGAYNNDAWPENMEMVTSTSSMNREQMVDSYVFTWFIKTFHMFGITNWISRFLFKYKNIDYAEFYDNLYQYMIQDPWFAEQERTIRRVYDHWTLYGEIKDVDVAGVQIHGWNLLYMTAMKLQYEKKKDYICNLVEKHIRSLDLNLEEDILDELLTMQQTYLIDINKGEQYPLQKTFNYNFYDYLISDVDFEKQKNTLEFYWESSKKESMYTKIERIFFQRRTGYTKAAINRVEQ